MSVNRLFCSAPMMDWSDRHCRYFWRLMTKNTLLYTEMVTAAALAHVPDPARFLDYSDIEHPIALQVGGSDPSQLANAVRLANKWRYDEINLNVGCPSDRVQNGMIGAILMKYPGIVADAYKAMADVAEMPVTIKHRIGIDDLDEYAFTRDFVGIQGDAGCRTFIVHARKAILKGLSPKENREVPPLNYDIVYQLKKDFPEFEIIINGGINSLDEAEAHLENVDGVMLGRSAYQNPMILSDVDRRFFGGRRLFENPTELLMAFIPYLEQLESKKIPVKYALKHVLGTIQSVHGARNFRRHLSENMHDETASPALLAEALELHILSATATH